MTQQQELTRVERRKRATRHALVQAGRDLIGRVGIPDLSVQALTDEADVALGTFYNYFPDKLTLFCSLLDEDWESHHRKVGDLLRPDDEPASVLGIVTAVASSRTWVDRSFARYTHQMFLAGFFPDERAVGVAASVHKRGVERGQFMPLPEPLVMASYFGTLMFHVGAIAKDEFDTPLDTSLVTLVDLVLRALGTPDEQRRAATQAVLDREPSSWWTV